LSRQIEAEELTIAGRRDEWSGLSTQCEQLQWATSQWHRRSLELQAVEAEQAQLAIAAQSVLPEFEARLRIARSLLVDQRVDQARIEQRAAGLRTTLEQMQQDAHERKAHVDTARAGWEQLTARIEAAEAATAALKIQILECESAVQQLQRDRDVLAQQVDLQQHQVTERTRQRESLQRQAEKATDLIARFEEESTLLIQKRRELIGRYRDDYQIDLEHPDPELTQRSSEHEESPTDAREALEAQITLLRQEIVSAGSVNMEALDELDELETRTHRLASQEQDLLEAKAALVRTMQKIDADSQSLFLETLATIRTNFQHLYRKSFGGGSADILLENPDDPESGIEIIATPPGKTTFSNNLLSGGEKALTAVSLIMAFFQYRPSPFCILDEVDAPFDEANIGRFVNILHEFLNSTKFIVVTHSKKTMTAANMIYGVTMQESGVSRQVAVKFEEVDDRGEILTRSDRSAA
jgi:chromosome segregation protein